MRWIRNERDVTRKLRRRRPGRAVLELERLEERAMPSTLPSGAIIFTASSVETMAHGGTSEIGAIDPATGRASILLSLPQSQGWVAFDGNPTALAVQADGGIIFTKTTTQGRGVYRLDPASGSITAFAALPELSYTFQGTTTTFTPVPTAMAVAPNGQIVFEATSDFTMSQDGTSELGEYDPNTRQPTILLSIPQSQGEIAGPLAVAADGTILYTTSGGISRYDPTTSQSTPLPAIPQLSYTFQGTTTTFTPNADSLAVAPNGHIIFTATSDYVMSQDGTSEIGDIDPTGQVTILKSVPQSQGQIGVFNSGPVAVEANGDILFTMGGSRSGMYQLDPTTGVTTRLPSLPSLSFTTTGGSQSFTPLPLSLTTAAPDTLSITGNPPSDVLAGDHFSLQVTAKTPAGTLDTGFNGTATIALANVVSNAIRPFGSSAAGPLTGNVTVQLKNGVGTFTNLALSDPGDDDSLKVTSPTAQSTSQTVDVTGLIAQSLSWDVANGGVDFSYSIVGAAPTQPVDVKFSWASGTSPNTALRSFTVRPGGTSSSISAAELGVPPAGAHYLLMQVDPAHNITENSNGKDLKALAYNPQITSITAKYSKAGDPNSLGRFFSGVTLNGEVFTVVTNDSVSALRPNKVTLDVGPGKLVLAPQMVGGAWDGETYVSDPFDGLAGLAPGNDQLNAQASVGGTTIASKPIGVTMMALPSWMTPTNTTEKSFDPATQTYTFAVALLNANTNTTDAFNLPAGAASAVNWFLPKAQSALDVNVAWKAVTGLDPAQQATVTGNAAAHLLALGQKIYDFTQSFPAAGGAFGATVDLDPASLNIKSTTFTYTDAGSKNVTLGSNQPITRGPLEFSYQFQTTLTYAIGAQITLNKNGTIASSSTLDFSLGASPLDGTLTVTSLLPSLFNNKVVSLLTSAIEKQIPVAQLAQFIASKLQDVGILPAPNGSATVTGSLGLHAHVGLAGTPLKPALLAPKLTGSLTLAVPSLSLGFTWLGGTYNVANVDLSDFLNVDLNLG